jgi:MoxR-like ATPase
VSAHQAIRQLQERISADVVGQETMVERLVIGLLADGHLLVEGLPGLAKTRAIKSLGRHLDAGLSRIQFTPDLLPADVTGNEVYHQIDGAGEFRFEPGPIFNNLVLADEINRAPAKVQSALLEAMEERQVTVAGTSHELPGLFLVMATQNPIEQEGTYPLPEAQMDRFLMHVRVGYPDEDAEVEILRLVRDESAVAAKQERAAPIPEAVVFDARREIDAIHCAEALERYIVDLVFASRYPGRYETEAASWIEVGASPRGGIGLDRCSRVHAWLAERDHVTPEDVRAVAHDVLRHRIILSYEASAEGITADQAVTALLEQVAVP